MKIEVIYQPEGDTAPYEILKDVKSFNCDGQLIVFTFDDGSEQTIYFEDVINIGLFN